MTGGRKDQSRVASSGSEGSGQLAGVLTRFAPPVTNLSRDNQRLLNIRAVHTALDWVPPVFALKDNASSAVTGCEKLQRLTGRSGV